MKIRETSYKEFEQRYQLGSYWFGTKFCPSMYKKENGGYGIRIKTGESWHGQNQSQSWDYFELDETDLILHSPRGLAKEYNKKVRVIDIEKGVKKYKLKK